MQQINTLPPDDDGGAALCRLAGPLVRPSLPLRRSDFAK
jgi:hypothetical protein